MVGEPGLLFRSDGALLEQAVEMLSENPRGTEELASRLLGIRGGPAALTHRLVGELVKADARITHQDGVWVLGKPAALTDIGFDQIRFAVVDVETTGGVAGRGGHIIEFAAVRIANRQIVDSFTSLVDPGVSVSPWITRLTGIRNGMIRGAPTFAQILPDVRRQLEGCVFVAHSVGFDWGFVREEMRRAGMPAPEGPRLCTVQLARRLLPGLERRGLDALAEYYDVEIRERHRARGDAIATARCLLRMLDDAERKGWRTWGDLEGQLKAAPKPKTRKKTGKKIEKKMVESDARRDADRQSRMELAARLEGRALDADR